MSKQLQYFAFPQDTTGAEEADRVIRRANAKGWLVMPELMRKSARIFGLSLSRPTMERIRRLTAYMWYADTLLDESPDAERAHRVYQSLLRNMDLDCALDLAGWCDPAGQENFLRDLLCLNGLFVSSFEGMPRERLNHAAYAIGMCAIDTERTRSVVSYGRIQALEGRLLARVFAQCLTGDELGRPGSARFVDFGERLFAMMDVLDAIRDFSCDFEAGIMRVRPTRISRVVLATMGLALGVDLTIRYPIATMRLVRNVVMEVRGSLMQRSSDAV